MHTARRMLGSNVLPNVMCEIAFVHIVLHSETHFFERLLLYNENLILEKGKPKCSTQLRGYCGHRSQRSVKLNFDSLAL